MKQTYNFDDKNIKYFINSFNKNVLLYLDSAKNNCISRVMFVKH